MMSKRIQESMRGEKEKKGGKQQQETHGNTELQETKIMNAKVAGIGAEVRQKYGLNDKLKAGGRGGREKNTRDE